MPRAPVHPPTPYLFDRALLKRRRDRAARDLAVPTFLVERAIDDVIDRLAFVRRSFPRILCLGAHQGLPARRLRAVPGVELVVEADSSAQMIARCDGPKLVADEELLPFAPTTFDAVVSPLALQFVNDLPGTLVQALRTLKPDGLFLATVLGGDTLIELRTAFTRAEAEITGGASPRVAPMADVRDLGGLLQRVGFALPVADSDRVIVTYPDPLALMRDLKAMGAGNVLAERSRSPMRRDVLIRAIDIYAEIAPTEGGRVGATFEIVTLTGWAPHPDQQKPLAPGSARMRLADALTPDKPDTTP